MALGATANPVHEQHGFPPGPSRDGTHKMSSNDLAQGASAQVQHLEADEAPEEEQEGISSFFVRALYDFSSEDSSSLSFRKGALIEVLTQLESGWWDGLLGNDVRGWFPSNYVEIISDDEAERELRMRAQHLMQKNAELQQQQQRNAAASSAQRRDGSSEGTGHSQGGSSSSVASLDLGSLSAISASGFDGLGLGRDFDTLRALMSGEGLSPTGNGDAFEELAEAAMSGSGPRSPVLARRANGASGGSPGDDPSDHTEGEHDSSSTTTIEDRVQHLNVGAEAAAAMSARVGKLRGRSMGQDAGVSSIGGSAAAPHRPRAATDAAARLGTPGMEEYGTPNTHMSSGEEEGSWSGASTRPVQAARRWGEGQHTPDPALSTRQSRSNTAESSTSKLSLGMSSIGSKSTGTTYGTLASTSSDAPARNGVDQLSSDAADVRLPWILRLTEDEQAFFFHNIDTKETRWEQPPAGPEGTAAKKMDPASAAVFREAVRRPSAITLASFESDESDVESVRQQLRAPGKSPAKLLASRGLGALAAAPYRSLGVKPLPEPPALHDAPPAFVKEADAAARLQTALQQRLDLVAALARQQDAMAESMSRVMSIISEFGTRSKTEADAVGAELTSAVASTLQSVRSLLYCAGSLALTPEDLEELSRYNSDRPGCLNSFPASDPTAMQSSVGSDISAINSGAGTSKMQALALQMQASIQPSSRKVIQALSKLILSARTLVELSKLEPTNAAPDAESAQILVYRMEQRRQRVREDATDLLRAASTLSAELDRHRATASQVGASLGWPKPREAEPKSSSGAAGVDAVSLGGGSAAAWRGSGFVLPSAKETAALRADAMGYFTNPFDLTRETRALLQSGRTALRRRPHQRLTERNVNEVVQPQHDDLRLQLVEMRRLLCTGSLDVAAPERAETPKPLPQDHAERQIVAPPASAILLDHAESVLQRAGTYLALLEDLDLASTLDLDGSGKPELDASDPADAAILQAKSLVREFAQARQDLYDATSEVFVDVQDAVSSTFEATIERSAARALVDRVESLLVFSADTQDLLQRLLRLSVQQSQGPNAKLGARAKVYGVVDLPAPISAAASTDRLTEVSSANGSTISDGGVLYLGPGIVVPDGPAQAQPTTRSRSSSTATSALAARRKDSQGADSDSEYRSPRGDKGKRMFGDDLSSKDLEIAAAARRLEADPWFLEVDYAPTDIVLTADGQVKGATLGALMERLTMHKNYDANFNNTFLLTYRSFTTTEELLDLLFARFRIAMPLGMEPAEQELWIERKQRPIQLRVFNVLKSWLETYLYEGEDERYLPRIRQFAEGEMAAMPSMALASKQLLRLIERREGDGEMQVRKMVMPNSAPPPILPKNLRKIKFLDIDPLEMARQLTLLDSTLFCRIKPFECLDKNWSKKDSDKLAPGIKDTINTSNRITGWVAEAILMQEDLKKRALWVKQFIAIAERCRALQNFSTMTAIVSGLNSAPVYRLRRTWDQVNQKQVAVLESLNKVMQSSKNFADYREMIHKLNPPCVPFLGVYLTDLTFIEDGNPDRLKSDERLINFGKRQKTAEVVKEIMIYQSTPFNLTPVPGIQKFINDNLVETRGDNDLYQQSLLLEPRERDDEKIARLLQESGFL